LANGFQTAAYKAACRCPLLGPTELFADGVIASPKRPAKLSWPKLNAVVREGADHLGLIAVGLKQLVGLAFAHPVRPDA